MSKKNFNGSIILLVATVVFQQFAFLYFHIYHPKQLAMPTISNPRSQSAASAIVLTGFIAGTLDITAACIQYYIRTGKGPANVLRYVASGVFGKEAFTGGVPRQHGTSLSLRNCLCIHLVLFMDMSKNKPAIKK